MRSGYVALIGRPNAGKSTLFNAFIGQRLSIVTAKPQTTRGRILGIVTDNENQIIFLDTPGLLQPSYKLHESMEKQIEHAAKQADLALLILDATNPKDRLPLVQHFLAKNRTPVFALLNKIDLIPEDRVDSLLSDLCTIYKIPEIIPLSALTNKNLDTVFTQIKAKLPEGPQLYPEDMIAEQPERFFAAELIREAAFEHLEDELPYSINIAIEDFVERTDEKSYILGIIYVERESQKGIVIGRKASRLQAIGKQARKSIEDLVQGKVYLELKVKVRSGWRNNESALNEFGYL
jgi:GTP-binding protein Era